MRSSCNNALTIDPRHPDAYAALASMFMMQGKTDKALKTLDQAVEIDPPVRTLTAIGLSCYWHGQIRQSTRRSGRSFKVAPDSARALRERAWILATCPDAKIRNGEQAVMSAAKACELTEWKDVHCLTTLAAACSESGDFDGAVKWQQKAIDLLPDKSPDRHEYRSFSIGTRPKSRIIV